MSQGQVKKKATKTPKTSEQLICEELDKLWDQESLEGEDLDRATDLIMQLGGVVEDDSGNVFQTTVNPDKPAGRA